MGEFGVWFGFFFTGEGGRAYKRKEGKSLKVKSPLVLAAGVIDGGGFACTFH